MGEHEIDEHIYGTDGRERKLVVRAPNQIRSKYDGQIGRRHFV